jgi:polysaccharide transporter, PST family
MNAKWHQYLPGNLRTRLEGRHGLQAIIGNMGWLFVDKFLRMGAGLFVGAWIARYLGPDQFGLLSFSFAFAALFGAFATLGLDGIVVRELVKNAERQNELMGSAFVLKLVGGAITVSTCFLAILLMHGREGLMLWLVGLSAAAFIFQSVNVIDFYFQARVQSRNTVIAANGAFILITLVKIFLVLTAAPLIAFAWAALGEAALTAAFLVVAYRVNHHSMRGWRYDGLVARELLRDSWPLLLSSLAALLYLRLDVVMLQQMVGDREVGIYAAATRISEVWYFLPMVVTASVSPSIIKCYGTDPDLYRSRLQRLYFYMTWMAIALSLPISLTSGWIVRLLYGVQFKQAGPVLAVHLWASVAVFLGVASSQYLLIEQLQKISFYRTLIGLICNIVLNLVLIPRFGAMGAAIATVVSYSMATFSMAFFKSTRAHSLQLLMAPFTRHWIPRAPAPGSQGMGT